MFFEVYDAAGEVLLLPKQFCFRVHVHCSSQTSRLCATDHRIQHSVNQLHHCSPKYINFNMSIKPRRLVSLSAMAKPRYKAE